MAEIDAHSGIIKSDIPKESDANDDGKEEDTSKDYCYICEDGGNIVDCAWCSNSCCYNIIGKKPDSLGDEPEACVSIPESMTGGGDAIFPCPKCVADRGMTSIGYFINRGARATMRVTSRTSVVIVIYHLNAFNALAKALAEQLHATLSSFYVTVACQTRLIHRGFTESEADAMLEDISRDCKYHVAVVFMTEGDPQGGWWHTVDYGSQKDSQVSEQEFLGTCLGSLRKIAKGAETSRVFGVSCAFNLKVKGAMGSIVDYIERGPFHSLVMPSTCSLLVCEYILMFPEIFLNLYYFGAGLERTLHRTWGKSKEARTHTGLVILDRPDFYSELNVRTMLYAPVGSRPLGVPLPLAHTICGCPADRAGWAFKTELQNSPEVIFIYRSKCCQVELQVGMYPEQRRQIKEYEVTLVVEPWNQAKGRFTFNETRNVKMKVFPPSIDGKGRPVDRSEMWTSSGRRERARKSKVAGM